MSILAWRVPGNAWVLAANMQTLTYAIDQGPSCHTIFVFFGFDGTHSQEALIVTLASSRPFELISVACETDWWRKECHPRHCG